jgi:hypothetical protein
MGAANSLRMTRTTIFWVFIYVYVRGTRHLWTAHHLPDGRFASQGALVELFLFIAAKLELSDFDKKNSRE